MCLFQIYSDLLKWYVIKRQPLQNGHSLMFCFSLIYTLPYMFLSYIHTALHVFLLYTHYPTCFSHIYTLPYMFLSYIHTTLHVSLLYTHYPTCFSLIYTLPYMFLDVMQYDGHALYCASIQEKVRIYKNVFVKFLNFDVTSFSS